MAIGILRPYSREKTDEATGEVETEKGWEGELRTLRLKMGVRLQTIPATDKGSDKAPDFLVYGNVVGHWAEVGRAWEYKIERGESAGLPMLSIRFDDEEVAEFLATASAFPKRGQPGVHEIVRERGRARD